jgi:hypothetical protein
MLNQWGLGWHLVRASLRNLFDKLQQKGSYQGLERLLDGAYRALLDGTQPPVSFEDMDRTSRLIDALIAAGNKH